MTTEMSDYLKDKEDRIEELERQKEILGKSADERAIAIQELGAELQISDILIADLKNKCIELRQQLAEAKELCFECKNHKAECQRLRDALDKIVKACNRKGMAYLYQEALNHTQDGKGEE